MTQQNTMPRAYSAAHFGLELDGNKKTVGLFRSIEGGGVTAEVMTYQVGAHYDLWRQLGKPKYDNFKLQVGMAMSEPFYDWIADFFHGDPTRKNGAILAADFYYQERARREFFEAQIAELQFPTLNGSDKNAAYMTVTVAPEKIVFKKGDGSRLKFEADEDRQKLWTACNFRFRLDGFEQALSRTTKIDSFTIKQKVIDYHMGGHREPIKVPGRIDFPTINFYVPEADAKPLIDEYMKHADKGEPSDKPLNGAIETFDNSNKDLFNIQLHGVHLKSATPDKSDAHSEEIKLVKFEASVESMDFMYLKVMLA